MTSILPRRQSGIAAIQSATIVTNAKSVLSEKRFGISFMHESYLANIGRHRLYPVQFSERDENESASEKQYEVSYEQS
jgi:hypothetical protein